VSRHGVNGGADKRGSAADRRRRTAKLLARHGDGFRCPCSWCGIPVGGQCDPLEQDRIEPGGPYRMDNLIPACGPCNRLRSDEMFQVFVSWCQRPDIAIHAYNVARGVL
jgi:hypothetical protein